MVTEDATNHEEEDRVTAGSVCPPNSAVPLRAEGWFSLIAYICLHISWEQSELLAGDSSKDAGGGGRARGQQTNRGGQEAGERKDRDASGHRRRSKCKPRGLEGLGRQQPGFLGMHIPGKWMETESPWWCP